MSVCLNHPNKPAEHNCHTCHKPVCGQCAVPQDGKQFCSQKCVEGYLRAKPAAEAADAARRKEKMMGRIKLAIFVILAIAAAAAYYYLKGNPAVQDQLQSRVSQAIDSAADAAKAQQSQKK